MFSLFLISGLIACSNGEIGWPTDPSYSHLFRPVVFTQYSLTTSSVGVSFTKVVDANKYVFELSEDSLQFTKNVRKMTLLADTLTPYATSATVSQVLYQTQFSDLNANTLHSIRMMAINKDSTQTTKYSQFTFRTPAENIFTGVKVTNNGATFVWKKTSKVTYVLVTKNADPIKNILQTDSLITVGEIADSTKTISGLEIGTYYTAKIYYLDGATVRIRGTKIFKTPGTIGSFSYNLNPSENINTVLSNLLAAGRTNITFTLTNGLVYNFGAVTVPSGISRLTFTASSGAYPIVNITKLSPSSSMDGFLFENLNLIGLTNTALFNIGSAWTFSDFTFSGCIISNYSSLFQLTGTNIISKINNITIENSVVNNIIGGSGLIYVSSSSPVVANIKLTNSTFNTEKTQLMDIRSTLLSLELSNCTFYNNGTANTLTQLFRFADNAHVPASMTVDKCIFAGNNGSTALKSFSSNFTSLSTVSFATCYRTTDLAVSTSTGQGFPSIATIAATSTDLFTDPANGIFTIKPTVTFVGKGIAGDPRWW